MMIIIMSVSDPLTWDETFTNFFHDLPGCYREDEIAWYHRSLLSLHKPKLRSFLDGFSWGEISKRESRGQLQFYLASKFPL